MRVGFIEIVTPNKLDVIFSGPEPCVKFHRNRMKIAAVESVPCYAIAMGQITSEISRNEDVYNNLPVFIERL